MTPGSKTPKPAGPKETALAASVVAWLRRADWTVYQEVTFGAGQPRADIVATFDQKKIVWVIECKNSLSLSLIHQAMHWRRFAHRVSVAVPWGKSSGAAGRRDKAHHDVLDELNIGLLRVQGEQVTETLPPIQLEAPMLNLLVRELRAEQMHYAPAGNAEGKRASDFSLTRDRVIEHIAGHPGCTIKEIVRAIEHHYKTDATARTSLTQALRKGWIRGVTIDHQAGQMRLYAQQEGAA